MFDFILRQTGQDRLSYIGHSMGSTQLLVLLSEQPEQNAKLNLAILMAPPSFMGNVGPPLDGVAAYVDTIEQLVGTRELFPDMAWTSWMGHNICQDQTNFGFSMCLAIAESSLDISPGQLNRTMLPILMDNWPEGSSSMPLYHYAQVKKSFIVVFCIKVIHLLANYTFSFS